MNARILIICPQESSSFVQQDASIFGTQYTVEILSLSRLRNPKIFWTFLAVIKKFLSENISCVVMWFSVPHLAPVIVVIARFFHAKILAITGGFDVGYVKSIDWGDMGSPWKRMLQRFTLRRVDRILPFSNFSRDDTVRFAPEDITSVVYPGIDTRHFIPGTKKSNLVVTTCNVINRFTMVQKGIAGFAQCAAELPEYSFLVIGQVDSNDTDAQKLFQTKPANLTFTERYVSDDELLSLYQEASVYVQISAHEGFGIACAEAMACGCVPIGTHDTSLPEVIGDAGFLVPYNDIDATVNAIKSAMKQQSMGHDARNRVEENFPLEKRKTRMLAIMKQILEK